MINQSGRFCDKVLDLNTLHGIIVFGLNGSGKTTLGRELARVLNYKFLDIEAYHFEKSDIPYSMSRSREECVELMLADIEKNLSFVIASCDGNLGDTIPKFYELAVYISVPYDLRMERIKQRSYLQHGERVLEGGDMYEQDQEFFNFVKERSIAPIEEWAKTLSCPVVNVDGTKDWRTNALEIAKIYESKANSRSGSERMIKNG